MSLCLSKAESAVLAALGDEQFRTASEVLAELREHDEYWCRQSSGRVRETLKALARRGLVERGNARHGEFRIVAAHGAEIRLASGQLRLV